MGRTYYSASGKLVDMDALRLKNESVVAVGNAGTNARGDLLGAGGAVIANRNDINSNFYRNNLLNADKNEMPPNEDIVSRSMLQPDVAHEEPQQQPHQQPEQAPEQAPEQPAANTVLGPIFTRSATSTALSGLQNARLTEVDQSAQSVVSSRMQESLDRRQAISDKMMPNRTRI